MSQRESGYERILLDQYQTPSWVTEALLPHLPNKLKLIWEPASGTGQMIDVLARKGTVIASDIANDPSIDFLKTKKTRVTAIITNPPYTHAQEFIEHALDLTKPINGMCAFLLRTDYDHAKSRQHLFANHPAFAKKLVLLRRIQWFEHSTASPSYNHAWYLWDHKHIGPPVIAYGPES